MLTIEPSGGPMCATMRGVDLSKPLDMATVGTILHTIGKYGAVCFPAQKLEPVNLRDFTANFGEVQVSKGYTEPNLPQVSILSNIVINGKNIGYTDAGLIWHRDMTYRGTPGFANVLYGVQIPHRDGKPLGDTKFLYTGGVYDELPKDVQKRLEGTVGLHDGQYYSKKVKAQFNATDPYSKDRHKNPPNEHPILMRHPITGKTILYCDIGHVARIEGLPPKEGEDMLKYLTEMQTAPKNEFSFQWTEGDVLMWDNLSSLHRGNLDYGPTEHRLIKRSQAMGNKIFDPAFMKEALAQAKVAA
jgi:taurine dioxygenase